MLILLLSLFFHSGQANTSVPSSTINLADNTCVGIAQNHDGIYSFHIEGTANLKLTGFSADTQVMGEGFSSDQTILKRENTAGDMITISLPQANNENGNLVVLKGTISLSPQTLLVLNSETKVNHPKLCVNSVSFNDVGVHENEMIGSIIMFTNRGSITL